MKLKREFIVSVFLATYFTVSVAQQIDRGIYIRSLAKLCGWAQCQGLCQYRDVILSPREYYNRRCMASRYNKAVQDAYVCPDAICITHTALSGVSRLTCRQSFSTQTACYSPYRNESTNKVQTLICWDQSPYCMDLVNFCKDQRVPECTSYSTVTTLPPTTTATPNRITVPSGPTGMARTTDNSTATKNTETRTTITSDYRNTVTAESIEGGAFAAGAVSGICAAAIPMIIAVILLMCLRRRNRNQFQISDANKQNDSMELAGGPVYASIGPELPRRQDNLARGDISTSARFLHISAPRGANLLGNLQRNKSLPALAYAVNSVPMERNDVLRTVSMANRLSGLSESPSSPTSSLSPSKLDHQQVQEPVHDLERSEGRKGRRTVPSWSGEQSQEVTLRDTSRYISTQNGTTGLTNKLYDEAILPGPPSKYAESEKGAYQYTNLNGARTGFAGQEQTTYTSLQTEPGTAANDRGKYEGIAEYTGLELNKSMDTPAVMQYAVLSPQGVPGQDTMGSDNYASLEHIRQLDTNAEARQKHQYTEYVEDEDPNETDSNEYMGIPEKPSQQGTAYMGLESNGANGDNQYMGIGEVGPTTVNVGNGAYTELGLLDREDDPKGAYMGLHSQEAHNTGDRKESYIGLDPSLNSGSANKDDQDKPDKRKFWKSKSTFHKRNNPSDGLGKQTPAKSKKSFLFRRKKNKLHSAKEETPGSDMCLDLNLSSPSPTKMNSAPQYFTLEMDSTRPHPEGTKPGSNITYSIPEYQEDEDYDAKTAEEPFRLRSQSQPVRQNYSTAHCEEYETITDDWVTAHSRDPS